jgi:hypothetical protein
VCSITERNYAGNKAEVIQNHQNPNAHAIGQEEVMCREYKRLKLGSGQTYDHSSD